MEGPPLSRIRLGREGEEAAVRFLKKKRFKIVERGFRMFRGEIDIIAYDRTTLVFVEVKTRSGAGFGVPEESVTSAKQDQLRKIAQGYLIKSRLGDIPCRFDVVAVSTDDRGRPTIRHIENAFE
jgi:putative endonuclease